MRENEDGEGEDQRRGKGHPTVLGLNDKQHDNQDCQDLEQGGKGPIRDKSPEPRAHFVQD